MKLHLEQENFNDLITVTANIQSRYESLHEDLLYTSEKQDFNIAIEIFKDQRFIRGTW
ncbi:MAG: hypothetical protein H6Q18_847 [Bacteroidetes bacterium]|nr:hypothetical protein [Bacteroidota bacterium]